MTKVDDLYFGIKYWDFNDKCLKDANLFDCCHIREMAARYIINKARGQLDDYAKDEPLMYIFGDVWSRCEWEFAIRGIVDDDNDSKKVDVFSLYVKPNKRLLLDMINDVSLNNALMWRRKNK